MRRGSLNTHVLIWLLLLTVGGAYSQDLNFNYRYFSVEDGLSSRFVNNVVQDDQGFIWLGTYYGVNRYDGRRFKLYQGSNSGRHYTSNAIIKKAVDGNIWINYDFQKIDVLDPKTGIITPLENKMPELKGKPVQFLNANSKKEIWGLIDKSLVFRYDGKMHVSAPLPKINLNGDYNYNIVPTPWGTFLLRDPLNTITENDFSGQLLSANPGQPWATFAPMVVDSSLWLLTVDLDQAGKQHAVKLWELQKGGTLRPVQLTKNGRPLPVLGWVDGGDTYTSINSDNKGNIWMVLNNKLLIFDKTGELIAEERPQGSFWKRLKSQHIFFDAQGQAWIPAREGVFTISTERAKFQKLLQIPELGHSVRGMVELPDNNLLACSYDGIFKVDLRTGEHQKISTAIQHGFCKASDGRLWFGAHSTKVKFMRPGSTSLEVCHNSPDVKKGDELLRIFEDPTTSTIYIGSRRQGLLFFNKKTSQVEPYRKLNQFAELASLEILDFCSSKTGAWVATSAGLYRLDWEKGLVAKHDKFPQNFIYHISEDKDGTLWLATKGGGLLHWNPSDGSHKQFSTANGLSNDILYAVYDDGLGYLWLPSNYGLMRFEKSSGMAFNYLPSDGIAHEEFNSSAHFRGADGTFYFGGLNGITAFHPAEITAKKFDAPLVAIDCKVLHNNQLQDRMAELHSQNGIVVEPDERFLSLEFALLDYHSSKQRFAWKLDGLDSDWTYQDDNTIRINALPYGKYKLRVMAQNTGNNWSKNELAIPITVLKPFYLTLKFAALCLLAVALLTFLFIRWRTKRLRQEQARLSILVEERTKELVQKNAELETLGQTKDRLFSIIAHDLRSPLITLGGLARKVAFLIRQDRTEEVYELGETVEQSVANVRNLLDNLLKWTIVQDGRFPHQPELLLADEVAEEVVGLYKNVAEVKGIQLLYKKATDATLYADRNSAATVIRNLVDNAIKFTHENGTVEVSVERQNGHTIIEVQDNGIGIPAAELPHIFYQKENKSSRGTKGEKGNGLGLVLCRELIEINHGSIVAFNKTGGGAVFVVKLPASEKSVTSGR